MAEFFILVCRECDPELEAPIPFATAAERGRWASEHTNATGHADWFVSDERRANG